MNLSLKSRVYWSFAIVNALVVILGFMVFFYLDSLNKDIEEITFHSQKINVYTSRLRESVVAILRGQRKILNLNKSSERKTFADSVENTKLIANDFATYLKELENFYTDAEIKEIIPKMEGYVDSLKIVLSKTTLSNRNAAGMASIADLSDKILDAFTELQRRQWNQNKKHDDKLRKIIEETKKTMMVTLLCTFLFTALLGLIIPGKIALPFKKINDALRELQECNFDVSIFYDQDDEIGEISKEMNKMISSMKTFEELRADRIIIEHKKFDTLASLTKRYVLVANAKGELIYMNNQLYSLLDISSDEVLFKQVSDILIPKSIREVYEMAIKRRTKIENAEVRIARKKDVKDKDIKDEDKEGKGRENVIEGRQVSAAVEEDDLFKGYANVVPIRGKESSLDYYLMVLSRDLFS
ncbi:MAG: hypothetical protein OXB88_10755 [Bacteriovoracales bacterium]|nr:hypothetical protein [Bacteriovoracales bacterium]